MYWGMDGSGQNFFYTSNQIWINRRNGGNTNFFFHFSLSLVVVFSYVTKANIKHLVYNFFLIPDV